MWPQALPQARAPRPLALGQAGPAVQAWRHFTVVAPAGAVGVGDAVMAERLALLRDPPPCAPTNGRPGFPFGFLGAGGRLPKARRGRFFIV